MKFWEFSQKLFLQLFIVCFPLFGFTFDLSYKFNSQQDWKEEKTFISGELEDLVWSKNSNAKILIGLKEEKRFFIEANQFSDEEIQQRFYAEAVRSDVLNKWSGRKVVNSLVQRSGDEIKVQTRYSMAKSGQIWFETNKYIFKQEGGAFFTLQYPSNIGNVNIKALEEQAASFDFSISKKSSAAEFKMNLPRFFNSVIWTIFQRLNFLSEASADDCSAELKRYPPIADWSGQSGSGNNSYEQLLTELTWKSTVAKPDQRELSCLAKLARDEQVNAAEYWARRGSSERCLTSENPNPASRPPQCSEQAWNDYNKATEQINFANEKLQKVLNPSPAIAKSKCATSDEAKWNSKALRSIGENVQEKYCCAGVGNKKIDPKARGPLAQILYKDEDSGFKNFPSEKQERECLDQAQPTAKRADLTACVKNVVSGLVQVAKSTFNTIKSVFTWEAEKALWNFIKGLPSSGMDILKMIGDYLGRETYVVNNCMNTPAREMYACKMSGEILTLLLGPRLILKFLGAIAKGAKVGALGGIVAEVLRDSPKLQKAFAAAKAGETLAAKALTPAAQAAKSSTAPVVSGFARKAIQIAKLDFSASIKEAISKRVKSKSYTAAAAAAAKLTGDVSGYTPTTVEFVEPPAVWKIESAAKKVKESGNDLAKGAEAKREFFQMAHKLDSAGIESNISKFRQISGELSNAERVDAASRLVGRELSKDEKIAILHSELIGKSAGRGYETYTELDMQIKRKILEDAKFSQEEVNKIEFSGLSGSPPLPAE